MIEVKDFILLNYKADAKVTGTFVSAGPNAPNIFEPEDIIITNTKIKTWIGWIQIAVFLFKLLFPKAYQKLIDNIFVSVNKPADND